MREIKSAVGKTFIHIIMVLKYLHQQVGYKHFIIYSIIESLILILMALYTPSYISLPVIALAYIGFIYVIIRLLNETLILYKKVKNYEFIKLDEFKEDNGKRIEIYNNVMKILVGMLFMISPLMVILSMSNNMQIELLNYAIMLLATIYVLYLVLRFKGEIITTIMILGSTVLGFFILITTILVLIALILMLIEYLLMGTFSFYPELTQLLTSLGMLALFIAKDFVYFWFNLGVALLVQVIIISIRPPYIINSTKVAFKIVSMIFTVVTVFLFFFLDESFEVYKSYTTMLFESTSNTKEFIEFFGSIDAIYNKTYFDKVIKGISIPYTIGSLIGLYLLDIKENRNNRKAKKFLIKSLYAIEQKSSIEEVLKIIRRTIYFGGSTYINIILCSSKFELYLKDLEYNRLFESKEGTSYRVRISEHLTSLKEKWSSKA